MNDRKRVLTGVRPTGPLHLGRYSGANETWRRLQRDHDCYSLIADWQVSDRAGDLGRRLPSDVVFIVFGAVPVMMGVPIAFGDLWRRRRPVVASAAS